MIRAYLILTYALTGSNADKIQDYASRESCIKAGVAQSASLSSLHREVVLFRCQDTDDAHYYRLVDKSRPDILLASETEIRDEHITPLSTTVKKVSAPSKTRRLAKPRRRHPAHAHASHAVRKRS